MRAVQQTEVRFAGRDRNGLGTGVVIEGVMIWNMMTFCLPCMCGRMFAESFSSCSLSGLPSYTIPGIFSQLFFVATMTFLIPRAAAALCQ